MSYIILYKKYTIQRACTERARLLKRYTHRLCARVNQSVFTNGSNAVCAVCLCTKVESVFLVCLCVCVFGIFQFHISSGCTAIPKYKQSRRKRSRHARVQSVIMELPSKHTDSEEKSTIRRLSTRRANAVCVCVFGSWIAHLCILRRSPGAASAAALAKNSSSTSSNIGPKRAHACAARALIFPFYPIPTSYTFCAIHIHVYIYF